MTKSEMIREHKRLLKVLKNGTKKERIKEYNIQKKELDEVLRKNGIYTGASR